MTHCSLVTSCSLLLVGLVHVMRAASLPEDLSKSFSVSASASASRSTTTSTTTSHASTASVSLSRTSSTASASSSGAPTSPASFIGQTGQDQYGQLSATILVLLVVVPVASVFIIATSVWCYCRRKGRRQPSTTTSQVREISADRSITEKWRRAFYGLCRRKDYDSITPLNPMMDGDKPPPPFGSLAYGGEIEGPRSGVHVRSDTNSTIGSESSFQTSKALTGSPFPQINRTKDGYWDGLNTPPNGRYTPVSLNESRPSSHHAKAHSTRSKTLRSSSIISLPLQPAFSVGTADDEHHPHQRDPSPLAWMAQQFESDGSDRATPVPWEFRYETERRSMLEQQRMSQPQQQQQRRPTSQRQQQQQQVTRVTSLVLSGSPYSDPHPGMRASTPTLLSSESSTPHCGDQLSTAADATAIGLAISDAYQPLHVTGAEVEAHDDDDERDAVSECSGRTGHDVGYVPLVSSPVPENGVDEGRRRQQRQSSSSVSSVHSVRSSVSTLSRASVTDEGEVVPNPPRGLCRTNATRR